LPQVVVIEAKVVVEDFAGDLVVGLAILVKA